MSSVLGGHLSRPTWAHRLPAWLKLLALTAASLAVLPVEDWRILAACLLLGVGLLASLGRDALRRLSYWRALLPLLAIVGLLHGLVHGVDAAAVVVLRIAIMVLLADMVAMTTTMTAMMGVLSPLLWPLKALGLSPRRLSLSVALVIRFVPLLLGIWSARTEAWRARSRRRVPLHLVALFLGDALRLADQVAEALDARGFDAAQPVRRKRPRQLL